MKYLRKCKHCSLEANTLEDLTNFSKQPGAKFGRRNKCRACSSVQTKEYVKREGKKQYRNYSKYGVTTEEYESIMSKATKCNCCGNPFKNSKTKHFDHDHETIKFRGVLCNKCNVGIGMLGDNVDGLLKALKYLTT